MKCCCDEVDWFIAESRGDSIKKCVLKLSPSVAVYNIWCERNVRIFQKRSLDSCSLSTKIYNSVREALLSWRNVKTKQGNP